MTRGFLHSHSYTGNALACRAALATLEIFRADDVIERNRAKAAYLTRAAQPLAQHPRVKNFRNTGMIWAFEVDTGDAAFARNFYQAALARELLLRPIGNTVYFMPPYVISESEMDLLAARTVEIIDAPAEMKLWLGAAGGMVLLHRRIRARANMRARACRNRWRRRSRRRGYLKAVWAFLCRTSRRRARSSRSAMSAR